MINRCATIPRTASAIIPRLIPNLSKRKIAMVALGVWRVEIVRWPVLAKSIATRAE